MCESLDEGRSAEGGLAYVLSKNDVKMQKDPPPLYRSRFDRSRIDLKFFLIDFWSNAISVALFRRFSFFNLVCVCVSSLLL